ncbi:hypothetical protein [Fontivita pretiosa]|uniref:hypothetical protein n=1 Tax=Fontivita pretiosa TaxID=2989684 RepID=UPI003D183060
MCAAGYRPRIYNGDGDALMQHEHQDFAERITLVPDALPSKIPDARPRLRIMWGQHLLEDLLVGRYHSLVCAVNPIDNSHGIISQLAALLPTSQWNEQSITEYARSYSAAGGEKVRVIKYDMDMLEVLAVLRPAGHAHLTLGDLASAFKLVAEMIRRKPARLPTASVSFLGARANRLVGPDGNEPSFEDVLSTMYHAGYSGDVYPSPAMWSLGRMGLFARYPFPPLLDQLRSGGF